MCGQAEIHHSMAKNGIGYQVCQDGIMGLAGRIEMWLKFKGHQRAFQRLWTIESGLT